MIKIIGPTNNPSIPISLNPVYIAINVKMGCIPILELISLGSSICLTITVITYKPIKTKAKEILPSKADIIAQGIITVPEP